MTSTTYNLLYSKHEGYISRAYSLSFDTEQQAMEAADEKGLRNFFIEEVVSTTKQYRAKSEFTVVEENND